MSDCAQCHDDGGLVLVRQAYWRLVRALDTPAFFATNRVIWNACVSEWTDLNRSLEPERRGAPSRDFSGLLPKLGRALQAKWA